MPGTISFLLTTIPIEKRSVSSITDCISEEGGRMNEPEHFVKKELDSPNNSWNRKQKI